MDEKEELRKILRQKNELVSELIEANKKLATKVTGYDKFSYKEIPFSRYWTGNLRDFYSWVRIEKKRLKPENACAQSCSTLDGTVAFENKYPTFEDAYNEWIKQWRNIR